MQSPALLPSSLAAVVAAGVLLLCGGIPGAAFPDGDGGGVRAARAAATRGPGIRLPSGSGGGDRASGGAAASARGNPPEAPGAGDGSALIVVVRSEEDPADGTDPWLPGAEVALRASDGIRRTAVAGEGGEARFEDLPAGAWWVVARTPEGVGGEFSAWNPLEAGKTHWTFVRIHPVLPLTGSVLAEEDGRPLADAEVRLVATTVGDVVIDARGALSASTGEVTAARTGPDGGFTVAVPRASQWWSLLVQAPGRAPREVPVEVPESPEEAPPLVIRLLPSVRVRGRVVDTAGRPLPGARVCLRTGESLWVEEAADAGGRFDLDGLPAGTLCRLDAAVEGLGRSATVEVSAPEGGPPAEQDLRVVAWGALEVTVECGPDLDPCNLEVEVRPVGEWSPSFMQRPAVGLPWTCGERVPGEWWVRVVRCRDLLPGGSARVVIAEGATTRCTIRPSGGVAIEGVLVDPEGRPLADRSIYAHPVEDPSVERPRGHGWSDGGGAFRIEGLDAGPFTLSCYGFEDLEVAAPASGLRWEGPGEGVVLFRLGFPPGTLPPRACTLVWGDENGPPREEPVEEGWSVTRPAGPGRLTVDVGPFAPQSVVFEVAAGTVCDLGTLELGAGAAIPVRVVDGDGDPVPGTSMFWRPGGDGWISLAGETDAEGRCVVRVDAAAEVVLGTCSPAEFSDETRTVPVAAAGGEVLFTVHRWAVVQGRLHASGGRPLRGEIGFFPGGEPDREADYDAVNSDDRGRFRIELPPGTWLVALLDEERGDRVLGSIEVRDGETREMDLLGGD